MRVLVTGHKGYIGSHIVKHLNDHHTIKGIDIEDDITDYDNLEKVFSEFRPDVVIHTAGLKSVSESFNIPGLYNYVNVEGTRNILKCMLKYSTSSIIFSSSATVYENSTHEDDPLKSINPYGETKILAEKNIINSGLNYCILRYFNPVGSEEDELSPNIYPTCIRLSKSDQPIHIYGNCVRDYFYVDDLARFHKVLLDKGFNKLVMNFGTGMGMSTTDFIDLFEKTRGVTLNKIYHPKRDGDKDVSVANVERFRTLFPEFKFSEKSLWLKECSHHLTQSLSTDQLDSNTI